MRLLGIDYGDKKIGLAIGDDETRISSPLELISNDETIFERLAEVVKSEGVDEIVVGVPLATGGFHGPEQLEKTRAFIAKLKEQVKIPIHEEDESYTTAESIRLQKEEGAGAAEDALAAMLILRAYLERL